MRYWLALIAALSLAASPAVADMYQDGSNAVPPVIFNHKLPTSAPIAIESSTLSLRNTNNSYQDIYQHVHPGANWNIYNTLEIATTNPAGATTAETNSLAFQLENYAVQNFGGVAGGVRGNAVGIRGDVYTLADGGVSWGMNTGHSDSYTKCVTGCTNRRSIVWEIDIAGHSASSIFGGITMTGSTEVQPAGLSLVAAGCVANGGAVNPTTGVCLASYIPAPFVVNSGVATNTAALWIGAMASATVPGVVNSSSQKILQAWVDAAGNGQAATQYVLAGSSPAMLFTSTGTSGYGLAVTGVGAAINLTLARNDLPLGAAEIIWNMYGAGKNSGGVGVNYTALRAVAPVTTNGVETGRLEFHVSRAGALTQAAFIDDTTMQLSNGTNLVIGGGLTIATPAMTGTAAGSLCITSAGVVFKKTTAGACL